MSVPVTRFENDYGSMGPHPTGQWVEYSDYEFLENVLKGIRNPSIVLHGGTHITPEEAVKALDAAMKIIEKVGTTGIDHAFPAANAWMEKYYPAWA